MFFKCRGLFWGVFTAGALIFPANFNLNRLILGFLFLIVGQIVRFWAAGYIPNYRTGVIGAPELVVWGPYKWVRNPLYLGNFVMGVGWASMLGWTLVIAFAVAFLVLYLLAVIPAEEKFLESKFGEDYLEYKKNVSSLIPSTWKPFIKENAQEPSFNGKESWNCEKYSLWMNVFITMAVGLKLYFIK